MEAEKSSQDLEKYHLTWELGITTVELLTVKEQLKARGFLS
jgi:hypothetical protein